MPFQQSSPEQQHQQQQDLESELRTATKEGDVDKIKDLVFLHGDDVAHFFHVNRLLHLAAAHGHFEVAKYILENNFADVEATNALEETVLMVAAKNPTNARLVQYLIKNGKVKANLLAVTRNGKVNLCHCACESGSKDMVEFFVDQLESISNSANNVKPNASEYFTQRQKDFVNAKTSSGMFPLAIAAQHNFLPIVEYLVFGGKTTSAIPRKNNNNNNSSMDDDSSSMFPYETILADVNLQSGDRLLRGGAALHFGSAHIDIVKFLVSEAHAIVDAKTASANETPLHYASSEGKLECVKFLVSAGHADVNAVNSITGETPLLNAISNGHERVAEYLIHVGANVNDAVFNGGWRSLHKVAWTNSLSLVKLLIDVGKAEFNALTSEGDTPLHVGCKNNSMEVVEFLIQGGIGLDEMAKGKAKRFEVDTTIKNAEGKTAKQVALEKGNMEIVEYFDRNVSEGGCCKMMCCC